MTKQLLAICLAAIGFSGLTQSNASAHEASAPAPAQLSALAANPAIARVNLEVVVEGGHRRHYRRSHYRRHGYNRRHYRHNNYRRYDNR